MHVDDVTIMAKTIEIIIHIKNAIKRYVEFTDGGEISWLLGIEIKRNRKDRIIQLRQKTSY